ncbi:MAG: sugar porter family MFS transporter [Verrucomicrobia bacterium]|nr:sugar porter family MFS transporter [Verrucomicrobiota bacterium]
MIRKFKFTNYALFSSLVASMSGLLFGYNTAVISGALLFMTPDFDLTLFQEGVVASTILIGALIGAAMAGFLADQLGRKKTLSITAILYFIGIFFMTDAGTLGILLFGRLIAGFGVGIGSVTAPLYIAEMAPSEKRGRYVSLNQLMITIGVLLAFIVCFLYSEKQEWREMFAFGFLPLALLLLGLFFIPETPSWLISQGKKEKAETILHYLRIAHPNQHLVEVEKAEDTPESKNWHALFKPEMRKPLIVGIGLSLFQQITGINAITYFSSQIFQMAGFKSVEMATFASLLLGVVNVSMTIIALWLMDKLGRRVLLIAGLVGMIITLGFLGFSFMDPTRDAGILAALMVFCYVGSFAVSLGPIVWLMISEIYPLGIRGRAIGLATFLNWSANYIVSLFFLSVVQAIGPAIAFWIFMLISLIGLRFVWKMVPETKGKTLEEIQLAWKKT